MRPIVLLTMFIAGCGANPDGEDDACIDLTATPATNVPTAVTWSWSTEASGTPTLTLEREGEVLTVDGEAGTDHSLALHGLATAATYSVTATVETADGTLTCASEDYTVVPPPREVLKFQVTISEPDSLVANGYLVLNTLQDTSSWAGVVDGDGSYRFVYATDEDWYSIGRARPSRDGQKVMFNYFDRERVVDVGGIATISLDGTVDERTRTLNAHHDFVEMPDGSLAWNGYDQREWPMDMIPLDDPFAASYSENCPGGMCPIAAESLYVGPAGTLDEADGVELLNWFDDWDVDPFWRCSHMTDFGSFVPGYYEWQHGNSLGYVDSQDAFYVTSRYLDTLYKINASTGAIEWEAGGSSSDLTLTAGEWYEHGHMSDIWEDGLLMFDNGDHRGYTRVAEFQWDEAAGTIEEVWSLDHPDGSMLPILGDARRLPNGNVLISWSSDAIVQEVTRDGTVVWEMKASSGSFGIIGRVTYLESLWP